MVVLINTCTMHHFGGSFLRGKGWYHDLCARMTCYGVSLTCKQSLLLVYGRKISEKCDGGILGIVLSPLYLVSHTLFFECHLFPLKSSS